MKNRRRSFGALCWDFAASSGLCCLLLLFLVVLTILGTLHQVDHGLYQAKKRFFESWFLWSDVGGVAIPVFPGGMTCMALLCVNLIAGGLVRLRLGMRTAGVLIVHVGILLLLGAGMVKMVSSKEGHLTLSEGERSDYFESYERWEVAIWKTGGSGDVVTHVIEHPLLVDLDERSRTFTSPDVPFDLVLSHYLPSSDVLPVGPMWEPTGPVVEGYGLKALPSNKEVERNMAGMLAVARFDGQEHSGILWARTRLPWTVAVGDEVWAVGLRRARYPMPFTIQLEDFQKEDHPGTAMAKAYRSYVTKLEARTSERVLIEMNEPLREGGLVLFQSGWGPQNAAPGTPLYSTFSVVENPADRWPEYSLWIITFGLAVSFGRTLLVFLREQASGQAASRGGVR